MSNKNITNPNSIYIPIKLSFEGYRKYTIHAYVDTGASVCSASKWIIPKQFWVTSEKILNLKIADKSEIKTSKVVKILNIEISGYHKSQWKFFYFKIPTIYQLETGIDFMIGNNFCQLYHPFIEEIDSISFTLSSKRLWILKQRKAVSINVFQEKFLDTLKIDNRKKIFKSLQRENIAQNKHIFLNSEEENKFRINSQREKILELLEECCSENPLDPIKNKGKMVATIELLDEFKTTIVRAKAMAR